MKWLVSGIFTQLILPAVFCFAQTGPSASSHSIEIKLPPTVISESFFIRYVLAGEDIGGWAKPQRGISSYLISTVTKDRPATGIRAILYAPGCAIQTLDLSLSEADKPQYSFTCQPVGSVRVEGVLTRTDRLYGRQVVLQAKYVARWASPFLKLVESLVTVIPVGGTAYLSADDHFRLEIPDLSQDPLASAPDHVGEIQIWAKEKSTEAVLAQLIPVGDEGTKARMGGLRIQREYPTEITFAPCAASRTQTHDKTGFASRPDFSDACDR